MAFYHPRSTALLFISALAITAQAPAYDQLPPEMRAEIFKDMEDVEKTIRHGTNGGPATIREENGEYILEGTPNPRDIKWVAAPVSGSTFISYLPGKNGRLGAGVFGSAKTVSQLSHHYAGVLGLGWRKHVTDAEQVIFLKGGPAVIPKHPEAMIKLLQVTPHVVINTLPDHAMMFNTKQVSSIQLSAE